MIAVRVLPDAGAVARHAATVVADLLTTGRLRVLGVATGSSPEATYAALVRLGLDWAGVRAVALDEYVGLPPDHPQRYRAVLERQVVAPLGLAPDALLVPEVPDDVTAAAACAAFERAVADAGGVDLQLLGIGTTGHIGFNEPGSPADSRTRVVTLTERTRHDNARFFASPAEVPRQAATQGVATIGAARRHLLLAQGEGKAEVVARALAGPVTTDCPASALQTYRDVEVLLDPAAASLLPARLRAAPSGSGVSGARA